MEKIETKFKKQFTRCILNKIVGRTRPQDLNNKPIRIEMGTFVTHISHTTNLDLEARKRKKKQLCNRFARADVLANCTITGIKTGWIHNQDGSQKWECKLEATPLNKLFYREANNYV